MKCEHVWEKKPDKIICMKCKKEQMNWKGKKVLVTGSEGMIGKELVIQLEQLDVQTIKVDKFFHKPSLYCDLTYKKQLEDLFKTMEFDYIFHLAGVKGNPRMTTERPVDFMGPMLQFDTNMILAAQKYRVKKFLYTSSIAVENPESDKYPAWAKQTAETLIEAMRVQYPKETEYCIVRPANVYGRFDNFSNPDSMVVTSLISKTFNNTLLEVWGDGSQVRDFINAKDVARGMIKAMEDMPEKPVNLCSGIGITIKEIAEEIAKLTNKEIKYIPVEHTGPDKKIMNLNWDFKPEIDIETGIKEVLEHVNNRNTS